MPEIARGIRVNNPLNIRISDANWIGKIKPSSDVSFEQFDTPEHGIRAGAKIIINYSRHDNIKNINGIIQRWAPSIENDTVGYVGDVCRRCGCGPFEPFDVLNPDRLVDLIAAMIRHECGLQPYAISIIRDGVDMALL